MATTYICKSCDGLAPVVVTDDEHWSGFRPDKIEALSQRLTAE